MKEQLLDRMIRIYGFENYIVIEFAKLMEKIDDINILETIVKAHEEFPYIEEEI